MRCYVDLSRRRKNGQINDFYFDYKKFDLQPGELLTRIEIPLPGEIGSLATVQDFPSSRSGYLDFHGRHLS